MNVLRIPWNVNLRLNCYIDLVEARVFKQLTPRTLNLEVWSSSLARRIVSLDKEVYFTLSLFTRCINGYQRHTAYIITHHGLGGFSGLINGLIAAAIGALSMLMSEPTAKSYVKRTCMFVLSIATFTFTFTAGG